MTMDASAFSIYQNLESLPNKNLCVQGLNVLVSIISVLPRLDTNIKAPQVLIVCASKEDAAHIHWVITELIRCTEGQAGITARLAIPCAPVGPSTRAKVEDQVVVGTSGTMKSYMTKYKSLITTFVKTVVVDEADGMFDKPETGRLLDTKRMLKGITKSGGNCQVILLSETSSERVKRSAMKEFSEVGSWSSVVVKEPSHDLCPGITSSTGLVSPSAPSRPRPVAPRPVPATGMTSMSEPLYRICKENLAKENLAKLKAGVAAMLEGRQKLFEGRQKLFDACRPAMFVIDRALEGPLDTTLVMYERMNLQEAIER